MIDYTANNFRDDVRGLGTDCCNPSMKVVTGTVVNGKVEVPPTLSPSDEKELSQALEEIHGGNFVDGWALINEIKAKSRV